MTSSRTAVLVTLAFALAARAGVAQSDQHARPIKVGVAVMQNGASRAASGTVQRDRLVREFASGKKKNKTVAGAEVVAVPLNASTPEELGTEARDQGCDYVLYTRVVELRNQGDPLTPAAPGTVSIGSDPLRGAPDPRKSQDRFYHAIVEYKLVRAGELRPRLTGSSSSSMGDDEMSAVTATLGTIANRVKAEVKSPAPVLPE
jgi:hypothetical protein